MAGGDRLGRCAIPNEPVDIEWCRGNMNLEVRITRSEVRIRAQHVVCATPLFSFVKVFRVIFSFRMASGRSASGKEMYAIRGHLEHGFNLLKSLFKYRDELGEGMFEAMVDRCEEADRQLTRDLLVLEEIRSNVNILNAEDYFKKRMAEVERSDPREPIERYEEMRHADASIVVESVTNVRNDPFTKKKIVEPLRNQRCGHVYDAAGLKAMLAQSKITRQPCECPVSGCTKKIVDMNDMKPYPQFFDELQDWPLSYSVKVAVGLIDVRYKFRRHELRPNGADRGPDSPAGQSALQSDKEGGRRYYRQSFLKVCELVKFCELLNEEKIENDDVFRTLVFVTRKVDADTLAVHLSIMAFVPVAFTDKHFHTCLHSVVLMVELMINYDLPTEWLTYLHRIGRTGRMHRGKATSFINSIDTRDYCMAPDLLRIVREVQQEAPHFLVDLAKGLGGLAGIVSQNNGTADGNSIAASDGFAGDGGGFVGGGRGFLAKSSGFAGEGFASASKSVSEGFTCAIPPSSREGDGFSGVNDDGGDGFANGSVSKGGKDGVGGGEFGWVRQEAKNLLRELPRCIAWDGQDAVSDSGHSGPAAPDSRKDEDRWALDDKKGAERNPHLESVKDFGANLSHAHRSKVMSDETEEQRDARLGRYGRYQ
ncbi:unnamed protein product [Toxocara canis]|uniref:E3 SUMO-protein ligase NSE2 n=1 Tax=Toxocara canis TaxID=6265 RepID=A0A183UHV9_TOXCA|nr:unnamed protein product [Toxocara canis]